MGVVWAIEHLKHYLYGKKFRIITEYHALISALNASERSKTCQSRLIRWIDRLMFFNFNIKHLAGSKMGLVDFIFRNSVGIAILLARTMRILLWRQSTHALTTLK